METPNMKILQNIPKLFGLIFKNQYSLFRNSVPYFMFFSAFLFCENSRSTLWTQQPGFPGDSQRCLAMIKDLLRILSRTGGIDCQKLKILKKVKVSSFRWQWDSESFYQRQQKVHPLRCKSASFDLSKED